MMFKLLILISFSISQISYAAPAVDLRKVCRDNWIKSLSFILSGKISSKPSRIESFVNWISQPLTTRFKPRINYCDPKESPEGFPAELDTLVSQIGEIHRLGAELLEQKPDDFWKDGLEIRISDS